MNLDRVKLPEGFAFSEFIGCLLVPGFAFYQRGPRLVGRWTAAVCCSLILIFFIWLGFPVANVAFGLLLSVHATGLNYYFNPWLADARFYFRPILSLGILIVLGCCLYLPGRQIMENRLLLPLRVNGKVVVTRKIFSSRLIKVGDWIAYKISRNRTIMEGQVEDLPIIVEGGFGIGPVLAQAGEVIRFSKDVFEVNGISHPLLPHMPASGELTVPENHWFVWPEVAISGHGNIGEANITAAMMKLGTISREELTGWKPFKHWFWRKQIPL